MRLSKLILCLSLFLILTGCDSTTDKKENDQTKIPEYDYTFEYDFEKNMEGWTSGFSGVNGQYLAMGYDINFDHGDYITGDIHNKAIYLAGSNLQSDLFMYTTKRFSKSDGLEPLTKYMVNLEFDAISTMATGLSDTLANAITVKAGVLDRIPEPNLIANIADQVYEVHGNDAYPVTDGTLLTTLGNLTLDHQKEHVYGLKAFQRTFYAQTNSQGELWIILGTDSVHNQSSSIYFDNIKISFARNE